jgi:ribosomal protein S27AE
MALPPCSLCENEPPILIQGDVTSGDQTFVGANCLPGFVLTAAAELTKDVAPDWCEAYGELFDTVAGNDRRPGKPPAAGVKRAKARKPATGAAEIAAEPPMALTVELDPACPECGCMEATGDDEKLTCNRCGFVIAVIPHGTG